MENNLKYILYYIHLLMAAYVYVCVCIIVYMYVNELFLSLRKSFKVLSLCMDALVM